MTQDKWGGVLGALLVLFAVLILIAERTPPILAAACLLTVLVPVCRDAALRGHLVHIASRPPVLLLLAALALLCGWMLATAAWSIAGSEAFQRGLRVGLMIAVAVALAVSVAALPRTAASPAARGAALAASIAILLLLVETVFDMPVLRAFRYLVHAEVFSPLPPAEARLPGITYGSALSLSNRLSHIATVVAILAMPLAAFLWCEGRRWLPAAVLAAAAAALAGAPTGAPLVAFLAGCIMAGLAWLPPRKIGGAAALLVALGVIVMPLAADRISLAAIHPEAVGLDSSAVHRLGIWSNTAAMIAERPLTGFGMEASRVLGRQGVTLGDLMPGSGGVFEAMPLHPHNAALQVWLELGVLGAIAFAVLCGVVVWMAFCMPVRRPARAAALAAVFSALTIAHLSFGIWQFWWIAVLGVAGAGTMLMLREGDA